MRVKMYIVKDMRQRIIRQMIVYLLGYILIARRTEGKQKQIQKLLEFKSVERFLPSQKPPRQIYPSCSVTEEMKGATVHTHSTAGNICL